MHYDEVRGECLRFTIYQDYPMKGALANSADPDQTLQNAASDQGLHCLH